MNSTKIKMGVESTIHALRNIYDYKKEGQIVELDKTEKLIDKFLEDAWKELSWKKLEQEKIDVKYKKDTEEARDKLYHAWKKFRWAKRNDLHEHAIKDIIEKLMEVLSHMRHWS
jgi:predicted transcriptional regulator